MREAVKTLLENGTDFQVEIINKILIGDQLPAFAPVINEICILGFDLYFIFIIPTKTEDIEYFEKLKTDLDYKAIFWNASRLTKVYNIKWEYFEQWFTHNNIKLTKKTNLDQIDLVNL